MLKEQKKKVRVIAFPGAPNLPIFAAIENGYLAQEGIDVALELTASSVEQAKRTASGEFDIVCTAFDNVVAYSEGQGAAGPDIDPQYVALMGATQLELSLVTRPEIESYADLKGCSIALDALSTGFAFVLYEMLKQGGLEVNDTTLAAVGATPQRWQSVKAGEHTGTLTIEPFTSIAVNAGFKVFDTSRRLFESYQGGVIAARRPFLSSDPDTVRGFIRGYLRGLAWTLAPENRDAAEALLLERMPAIRPEAVKAVMKSLLSPQSGLTPDAELLPEGMKTVLDLRSRYGGGDQTLVDPHKYFDLSHYEAVISAG